MEHDDECEICKNNEPFELSEDIVNAALHEKLVVFCGAGISTETSFVYPYSFYDDIAYELEIDNQKDSMSFPNLMSEYCKEMKDRRRLLI